MARRTYRHDVTHDDDVHTTAESDTYVERSRSGLAFDSVAGRINAVLFALLLALETLLALRFTLVAFGANPESGFVDFILDVSRPFVAPFDDVFNNRTWDKGIIEVNTLLAMGVYFLGYLLVMLLVNALVPRMYHGTDTAHSSRTTHV